MSDDCNCAPDANGIVIHNSWAHDAADMKREYQRLTSPYAFRCLDSDPIGEDQK